ncbi:MAG: hypothetical protein E6K56_02385 [Ignavibacteria bacterium]|nr:MAG: hypothetical protein E6K56_02385 [Ignavibacteria bacterium]
MDARSTASGRQHLNRKFPLYGLAGFVIIVSAELLLLLHIGIIGTYFTPLVWTGYILLADALNLYSHGRSLIISRRGEFLVMLPWSIVCWCVFEAYNLYLRNWTYIGLPDDPLLRYLGYGWSFATIFPAVLETAEFIQPFLRSAHFGGLSRQENIIGGRPLIREGQNQPPRLTVPLARSFVVVSIAAGLVCLVVPLLLDRADAARAFALVWVGFFLLLDPVNHSFGGRSILADLGNKNYELIVSLTAAGLLCGILWEFWNYWAVGKWVYSIPIPIAGPKLFEMPLLGYLGFIPFAYECWAMQQSLLLFFPAGSRKRDGDMLRGPGEGCQAFRSTG